MSVHQDMEAAAHVLMRMCPMRQFSPRQEETDQDAQDRRRIDDIPLFGETEMILGPSWGADSPLPSVIAFDPSCAWLPWVSDSVGMATPSRLSPKNGMTELLTVAVPTELT
jgi:hypothetical protein